MKEHHWHLTVEYIVPTAVGVAITFQVVRLGCVFIASKNVPVISKGAHVLGSLFTFGGA